MLTYTVHTECVSVTYSGTSTLQCHFVFRFELGMGSVDPVCDMSTRHVSHGRPMDVAQSAYTLSQIEWNFHDLFILLLCSDWPTVRQFLLKQTQLKCVMFRSLKHTKDVIDTVKVLKCYSGTAT